MKLAPLTDEDYERAASLHRAGDLTVMNTMNKPNTDDKTILEGIASEAKWFRQEAEREALRAHNSLGAAKIAHMILCEQDKLVAEKLGEWTERLKKFAAESMKI